MARPYCLLRQTPSKHKDGLDQPIPLHRKGMIVIFINSSPYIYAKHFFQSMNERAHPPAMDRPMHHVFLFSKTAKISMCRRGFEPHSSSNQHKRNNQLGNRTACGRYIVLTKNRTQEKRTISCLVFFSSLFCSKISNIV